MDKASLGYGGGANDFGSDKVSRFTYFSPICMPMDDALLDGCPGIIAIDISVYQSPLYCIHLTPTTPLVANAFLSANQELYLFVVDGVGGCQLRSIQNFKLKAF